MQLILLCPFADPGFESLFCIFMTILCLNLSLFYAQGQDSFLLLLKLISVFKILTGENFQEPILYSFF